MNVLGYLITLANLQNFSANGQIKDISLEIDQIGTLTEELKRLPGFTLECYKQTGYCRYGDVGKYLSKNLLEHILKGSANPTGEAVVITLYFNRGEVNFNQEPANNSADTLSYFLHKPGYDITNNDVQNAIIRHLNYLEPSGHK